MSFSNKCAFPLRTDGTLSSSALDRSARGIKDLQAIRPRRPARGRTALLAEAVPRVVGSLRGVFSFELVDAGAKAEHRTYDPPHAHCSSDTACIEFIGDRLQLYRAARSDLRHDGGEFYRLCVGFHLTHLGPDTPLWPKSIAGRSSPQAACLPNTVSHSPKTVWPALGSRAQPYRLARRGATASARRWGLVEGRPSSRSTPAPPRASASSTCSACSPNSRRTCAASASLTGIAKAKAAGVYKGRPA
jgi:hypothetical protein